MSKTTHQSDRFPCVGESLTSARETLIEALGDIENDECKFQILIAIGEIWQNIIRHGANGGDETMNFWFKVHPGSKTVEIIVDDDTPPSDMAHWNIADRPPEMGGMGLKMVSDIAKSYQFEMTETGNRVTLVFDIF